MKFARTAMGALIGVGLITASISSAEARPRGWGDRGWHRHHGNGFNAGDAIGIAALIGAVAVVATSVSKDRAVRRDANPDYNPDYSRPSATSEPYTDDSFADPGNEDAAIPLASEDRAVDACAVAAREEATRSGGYAEIRRIGAPQASNGGYDIDGEVERRGSYRDAAGETRRFTCTVQGDRVAQVYLSRDLVSN